MLLADNWQPSQFASLDERWLARAIDLARRGASGTRPNPNVGAVLARGEELLAEGWHERCGGPHAERVTLDAWAGTVPPDATLYVSLEPCAHHGRQPPCADLILERSVARVVFAAPDRTGKADGAGPRLLRRRGVEVARGPEYLRRFAEQLNPGFTSVAVRQRPYVTLKIALTADHAAATGDPVRRWVSSEQSRAEVHALRARSGAVLVGGGTVRADDPQLTVRGASREGMLAEPLRVVLTGQPQTLADSGLVSGAEAAAPVVVAAPAAALAASKLPNTITTVGLSATTLAERWGELMRILASGDAPAGTVNDVLVEAGPSLAEDLAALGVVDRFIAYRAPEPAAAGAVVPRLAQAGVIAAWLDDAAARRIQSGRDERIELVLSDPAEW